MLLAAGADAGAARWDGETALMIASRVGSAAIVNLLIARGAKVNAAESRKGQTALMWAAAERHPEVVRALIAHGANVRAASKRGFTALVFAATKNDSQSAEALLDAGADPNDALPDGPTVLDVAASYRSVAVANLLADRGANPNVADRDGNTPLHIAARSGCRHSPARPRVRPDADLPVLTELRHPQPPAEPAAEERAIAGRAHRRGLHRARKPDFGGGPLCQRHATAAVIALRVTAGR